MAPEVAIVFIIFFFLIMALNIVLIYRYKSQKEKHIHDEAIHISDNQRENIKIICSYLKAVPPDNHTAVAIPFMEYQQKIAFNALNEYEQSINGDLAPVRKKKKRIWNHPNRKGVEN